MPKYGPPRLKFPPGQQRKFILSVFEKSGLKVDTLAKIVNVSPRTIRDWKREKFYITEKTADIFSHLFKVDLPKNKDNLITGWINKKLTISRMGAIARFNKHGQLGTPEGRKKGGTKAIMILRKKGLIPLIKTFKHPSRSHGLAEFVGIMLGDGGITPVQMTITLNREADKDYINYVRNLCMDLFGEAPKHSMRKDCLADNLYYNGVSLISFLVKIGLKIGNKVRQQVDVPDWIKTNRSFSRLCCRGLMDTDGGIFLHNYKVNGKQYSYKKISFSNRSLPLLTFVYKTLKNEGLHPKILDSSEIVNKQVWLYNTHEVPKYLEIIGSSNQRLLRFKEECDSPVHSGGLLSL